MITDRIKKISLAIALLLSLVVANAQTTDWETIAESVHKLKTDFKLKDEQYAILINPKEQLLFLIKNNTIEKRYPISTATKGLGEIANSDKTPRGTHKIRSKFGKGAKLGTIFKARANTRRVAKILTDTTDVPEDDVTTRIMWLTGLEKGKNKGRGIDSYRRYIYIHGTPEEGLIGKPASHGCIRMKNQDVMELFDKCPVGTLVEIMDSPFSY